MERPTTPTEDNAVTEVRRMRVAEGRSSFCGFPPPALAPVWPRAMSRISALYAADEKSQERVGHFVDALNEVEV